MTRFLPVIAAAAASLVLATGTQAQSLQIVGLADASFGRLQPSGEAAVWKLNSGSMSRSFIGLRGTEEVGVGVKAKFAIEHYLRLDHGSFDGSAFWAKNAYVGLQGAFGSTTLGRHTTPLFASTAAFNAFGDSFGFSPSVRQLFTPSLLPFFGDIGWDNSAAYTSNNTEGDGPCFTLLMNLGEGAAGARGRNIGSNLVYFSGPLGLTLAWQQVRNGSGLSSIDPVPNPPAGFSRQDTLQLGASYDLSVLKLFGQATQVYTHADANSKTTLLGLGLAVPLGAGKLLVQLGNARATTDAADTKDNTVSLGYDHALSKLTDVYAVFVNHKVSNLTSGNSLAAGVRVRF